MVSFQQNRGASNIAFAPTTTSTPRSMLFLLLLHKQTKKAINGQRHNNKYVFVSMDILSYSIHIQFFLQNHFVLSLIENQITIKNNDKRIRKTAKTMMMIIATMAAAAAEAAAAAVAVAAAATAVAVATTAVATTAKQLTRRQQQQ